MNSSIDCTIPIIILNWNGIEDTRECMTSVLNTKGIAFHVFLIDNNSDNKEGELLRKEYDQLPNVSVIINKENYGFTKGNNRIIQKILQHDDYTHIALLNNDTVVTPFWLYHLYTSASNHNADMVASKMINYYDRSIMDNAGHFMLNTAEILPIGHAKPIEEYKTTFDNLGACGGGALYSTKLIRAIGLFDEFFDTGYEDAEYGLRANKLGYKSIFAPKAVLFHKVSRSIKKIRNDAYFIQIQRNIFYTYFKLIPIRYILLNTPFITAKYLFLFLGAIITLKFKLIKLHLKTIWLFFSKDLASALNSRKHMIPVKENNHEYLKRIHFFIKTDAIRFLQLFQRSPQG